MRTTHKRMIGRADRVALFTMIGVATLFVAVNFYYLIFSLRQKLVDGLYSFTYTLAGNTTFIPFPETGTATVLSASQSSDVGVQVSDLSAGVVALVVVQHLVSFLIIVALAGAFVFLSVRLLRSKPFMRSMTIALTTTSFLLLVLGTGSEVLTNLISSLVRDEITGGSLDTPIGGTWGWTVTGVWIMVGITLAVVASAFRIGERMQHDTEGLV